MLIDMRSPAQTTIAPPGDTRIVGVGAGGHARCVIEAIESARLLEVVALMDGDVALVGSRVLGRPVLAQHEGAALRAEGVENAFVGVGGVANPGPRRAVAAALRAAGFRLPPIVHATAVVAESATLEDGAQVLAGAIVGPGATVGRDALVNAGAIIGHDVRLGECVHIASGARIAGDTTVGADAHVGTGAIIIQQRAIGEGAVIGAGAVVLDDVAAGERVGGIPARPLARQEAPA